MITATVSSKYQVVIPKEIREKLNIKVGQKFQILHYGERIEFIPQKSVRRMRGVLKEA